MQLAEREDLSNAVDKGKPSRSGATKLQDPRSMGGCSGTYDTKLAREQSLGSTVVHLQRHLIITVDLEDD